tara:strand:+ start:75 stop:941 length:867 start_codon:yes stop_codon:yes gene_type:complete
MPWYVYSLLASILFAIIPLQKRKFNHSPKDIVFWSSLFAFALTLAMFPLLEFPDMEVFYIMAIFTGFSGVFGGILQFKLAEKHMGRTLQVQLPVQILSCFAFYCFLQPEYYSTLFANPYASFAAGIAIILLILSSQFLRKSDNTLIGFLTVVPIGLLFAFIMVYYKLVMDVIPGNVSNIILAYIMVHYFTVSVCFFVENLINKDSVINISEKITSSSLLIAVLSVFAYYFLFTSVYYASNPAYPIAFNMLIPVWIKLYNTGFLKKADEASLKISVIMLLSICILAVAG